MKFLLLEKFHVLEKISLHEAKEQGCDTKNMIMSSRVATLLDNGQCTASELSKTLGISRQATHKAIKNLLDRGLVTMENPADNKKVKIIILTDLGKESFKKRKVILQKIEDAIAQKIGKENLLQIKEILMLDWE